MKVSKLKKVKINFSCFWRGFDPEDFFVPLVKSSIKTDLTLIHRYKKSDIYLESVFQPLRIIYKIIRFLNRKASLKIWYTGENIRANSVDENFTLKLSFDKTNLEANNLYLPIWFTYFPEIIDPVKYSFSTQEHYPPLIKFSKSRSITITQRPFFACIFLSEIDDTRRELINLMENFGEVHVFGKSSKNFVIDKISIASNYKFIITPENSITEGYVTEKLFDGWVSGAIPIWMGPKFDEFLNYNAFINVPKDNIPHLSNLIKEILRNPSELDNIARQPLLKKLPDIQFIKNNICDLFLKNSTQDLD